MKPAALLKRLAEGQMANVRFADAQRLAEGQMANVRFADAQRLAEALGFELDRVRGGHHVFRHPATGQRLNLQASGGQAKPYQLRQLLDLVERHALRLREDDE